MPSTPKKKIYGQEAVERALAIAKKTNGLMREARVYVTEDVKRRVTGKPTQRQEKEKAASKVRKLDQTRAATMKKGGQKHKLKQKKNRK